MELTYDPAVAPPAKPGIGCFCQTIRLTAGDELIGQARWICGADVSEGVGQILELTVTPTRRRHEFGRQLMEAVAAQAKAYFKSQRSQLRRLWMPIEQKRQVIGRSFLMQFGFHHVGTVHELLTDEDLLIYMRTFN